MEAVTENAIRKACFAVLGESMFYTEEEIADLQEEYVELEFVNYLIEQICSSGNCLEDLFESWLIAVRDRVHRHKRGMVFTPEPLVREMLALLGERFISRVVDCGCGAGRFALRACEMVQSPRGKLQVLAYDTDPLACLLTKTAAHCMGLDIDVVRADFTNVSLPEIGGVTAFVGNPPYIRHHDMTSLQKDRGAELAKCAGVDGWTKLAGLHAVFLFNCIRNARSGDKICLLTGAEWLDVNYGRSLRNAFASEVGGGCLLKLYSPDHDVFSGTLSTALVSLWNPKSVSEEEVRLVYVDRQNSARDAHINREAMLRTSKWSSLFTDELSPVCPDGYVELGQLFRVSRGLATGNNRFFVIKQQDCSKNGLEKYCKPVVARAADVPKGGGAIQSHFLKKSLLLAPKQVPVDETSLAAYIALGEAFDVDKGYVTSRRKPWWHLTYSPAPVLATYMGRGRPRFSLNPEGLPNLNTVHGLYPKKPMTATELDACVAYLNDGELFGDSGRTYQGGLRKYEPKEMERILIPPLAQIVEWRTYGQKATDSSKEMER